MAGREGAGASGAEVPLAAPSLSRDAISLPGGASGRRRNDAVELFVLGELLDGPHHGYLLRDILGRMLGPYRQVSWAAIYPLIHQLERAALIEPLPLPLPLPSPATSAPPPESARAANGRPRRVLRITAAGRRRFTALMAAPGAYTADYHELFAIKLLYLRWLAPAQQQAILEHGLVYLRQQVSHLRHVFTAQSTTAHLPAEQRDAVTRMIEFRLASAEAEARWVADALSQLAATATTS